MNFVARPLLGFLILLLAGCHSAPSVVPETFKSQVDPGVTFEDISVQPEKFQGTIVVWGGEVLRAVRLSEATQLEVLQLPLDKDYRPSVVQTDSRGRFLALDQAFLDPATFPTRTRVTIVGEVTGVKTGHLDEMVYQYPTLAIKHLHVWQESPDNARRTDGPWYGIFGGGSTGGGVGGGVSIGIGF